MTSPKKPRFLPRFFAGFGYFFCLLQWLWIVLLVLPSLIDSGLLASFAPPPVEQQAQIDNNESTSPLLLIVAGVVTVLMIIISIMILVKFPGKVAHTGSTITHKTADLIVPVVSHHKPMSVKKRRILTERILLYVKLTIVTVPPIACFFVPTTAEINRELVIFIASSLALMSLIAFALEYATASVQARRTAR